MFCKRGIYVNWGNIPHLEFDFGPINLFSGGNGSGKTTAADGLQSLMTAAHENLFTYNPGQDETTQRGRGGKQVRTLASYVLGCDDGSYARLRPTDGYVGGVFHPTQGENCPPFTAVMCVRARLDNASRLRQARQDQLFFMVLPGIELSLSDFVCEDKGGKYVVPITEIAERLGRKHGKTAVEVYDKKGPYLRRLYGAFRGLKGAVPDREAKHAARTFSNFMAYKPVKSITEFVAKEVLEPKDLSEDIRQVSELMKTIHSMDEETRQLQQTIQNLDTAQQTAEQYISSWIALRVGEYGSATRNLLAVGREYLAQKKAQYDTAEAIKETEAQLQQNADKKQLLHEQLISTQAQRQGIQALKDKDRLSAEVEQFKDQLVKQVPELLTQDQQLGKNHQAAGQLLKHIQSTSLAVEVPALENRELLTTLKSLCALSSETGLNAQELLTKDWLGIASLEEKLNDLKRREAIHNRLAELLQNSELGLSEMSIRDQVQLLGNKKQDELAEIKQQLAIKQNEIQRLENQRVNYPPHVEIAIQAINEYCPNARPSVLCEFITVTDPNWQMAIEGYIGGARFSIIVEADYEAEAINIVRNIKGQRATARIVQSLKSQKDATRLSLPNNSIFDVMRFEHKTAEYYIKASYGNVVRVDNAEALRHTARGVTATGLGSGNYSMFRCDIDEAQLVFGLAARERALTAKRQQWHLLEEQYHQVEEHYRQYKQVHELVSQVQKIFCTRLITKMLKTYQQLQQAENMQENLDLGDHSKLEEQLVSLREEFNSVDDASRSLSETLGAHHSKAQNLEKQVLKLVEQQEALQEVQEEKENIVKDIQACYPDFNAEEALNVVDKQAKNAESTFNEDNLTLLAQLDRYERQLYDTVIQHNQMSSHYNSIAYQTVEGERNEAGFFQHVVKLKQEVMTIYNRLKNNVLVDKHEQLSSLKDSFNTAFVTNLCHSIYQSINQGKRTLDELNRELEHHRFGSDQERFYFDYAWVPEFKEYWKFFKEVIDTPNLGDGSTLFEASLSKNACEIRDKMLTMLLDKDEQTALKELARLSDYRNYRQYEIYKEPLNKEPIALSTYGTGSGGQLETPAYIIRSAAVTSAFHFGENGSHCRTVLVDEAFSKMDESRSREVIRYLTETLGLQLIFIMPTSKSGPFMDLISHQVIFSKCPTANKVGELNTRVLVDRKTCNQEKIKALWSNHRNTIRQQAMLDFMVDI